MPLLRYRTKDLTSLMDDVCPCGRTSVRMRLHHAQDGQPHLGPHPRHACKHLKAGLLLLGGKAEQADIVLGNRKHRVDGGFAPAPGSAPATLAGHWA